MDNAALHPWMLAADWRSDRRPFVVVDLATWPADTLLAPLPPVPVIAVGTRDHPQATSADVLIEEGFTLGTLAARIAQTPQAAAALVQLLRNIEGLESERALPLESFALAMLQAGAEHAAWQARQPVMIPSPSGILRMTRTADRLDLVIDRPGANNAIDRAMRDALFDAFTLAAIDGSIAMVRVRGSGRVFSVGADLPEFGTSRDPVEAHAIRARTLPAYPMAVRAAIYDVHVQGGCVGSGLELAAFAGRLTASPAAWFRLPEVGMGILPGFGGCVSIPRRIGRQRAALLMLSGRRIGAETARRWGLVDGLVDEPPVDDRRADQIGG